jgi:folate-dependent phosphoribosylglycinamide formyltransferase PurN
MKLYDPMDGDMQIAGLMSGSGSNLRRIIELEQRLCCDTNFSPYHVAVIFTDNPNSKAQEIGSEFGIPVIERDIRAYYHARNKPLGDMLVRQEFDSETVGLLRQYGASVAAYAGYMAIATPVLVNAFFGVNVHPGDLRIMDGERRKYTGRSAVRDALAAGETHIRSTTHIVSEKVDGGELLMVSPPIRARPEFGAAENQELLKELGDWLIFPRTMLYLSQGKYCRETDGWVYYDGQLAPVVLR